MNQTEPALVKSASRALDVLEFVASASSPPTFADLGEALGIPRSSLFYLLTTLTQRGYLMLGESQGYVLGTAVAFLAGTGAATNALLTRTESLVEQVGNRLSETASYMERRGDEMECVISRLGNQRLLAVHRVGQRAPLYAFSGGKIFLAEMDASELDAYFARTQLIPFTKATLTSKKQLRADLDEVRRTGFGIVREEHGQGIFAVSVGLRIRGRLLGTLGIAMASIRISDEALVIVKKTLQDAANQFLQIGNAQPETGGQTNLGLKESR